MDFLHVFMTTMMVLLVWQSFVSIVQHTRARRDLAAIWPVPRDLPKDYVPTEEEYEKMVMDNILNTPFDTLSLRTVIPINAISLVAIGIAGFASFNASILLVGVITVFVTAILNGVLIGMMRRAYTTLRMRMIWDQIVIKLPQQNTD
jgi:hypothetical protein